MQSPSPSLSATSTTSSLPSPAPSPDSCANCASPLSTPFCGVCGQRAVHGRLDLHELTHEAWHAFTHLDSGILRLLSGLALRPAQVYREYLAGARKRYFNPVLFLTLVEGAYIALSTSALRHHLDAVGRSGQAVAELAVLQADNYRNLIALPIIALVSWALSRARYTLAEVGVFWLFCIGFVTAIELVSVPLHFLWPEKREGIKYVFGWISGLTMLAQVAVFFGGRGWRHAARVVGIVLFTLPVLNYAFRLVYRLKGFEVDMGVIATLRDSFGL